jgi:putative N6-adenine-specific DNA methylase
MLLNPPYGERIAAAGVAGERAGDRANARASHSFSAGRSPQESPRQGRESAQMEDGGDGSEFFERLAAHWKSHYAGWSAWLLTPDLKLPGKMRFKESRRVPLWNGAIECRLFRFDLTARRAPPAPRDDSAAAP